MTFDTNNTEQLRSQRLLISIHSRLYTKQSHHKSISHRPVDQQCHVTLWVWRWPRHLSELLRHQLPSTCRVKAA